MCPACIATRAPVVGGATSTGGLTAMVLKTLRAETGARRTDPTTQTVEPVNRRMAAPSSTTAVVAAWGPWP
jgi:hypothetical protein